MIRFARFTLWAFPLAVLLALWWENGAPQIFLQSLLPSL